MKHLLQFVLAVLCFQAAEFSDNEECVIELECEECLPEHAPAVRGAGAGVGAGGAVHVPAGGEVALACGRGHFLQFPRAELVARCEAGRFRVAGALHELLDLGCQHDVHEDVQHAVEHCAPPLQGRAYVTQEGGRTRHLATLCFDSERGLAAHAHAAAGGALPLAAHSDARAPLSLLGNFESMFDAETRRRAERLYSDGARLQRRLRERFKHSGFAFAGQELAAGKLLAAGYFPAGDARVSEFVSNKVVSWRSVVEGNLRHVHEDVAAYLARAGAGAGAAVHAGTHGVLALRAGEPRPELRLGEGGRFPAPRYVWTAVVAPSRDAAVVLVLLNDPFVTVSEVREAVFCASACSRVSWLRALQRHRSYERPLLGLVFCCEYAEFAARVPEAPPLANRTLALLT